MPSSYPIARFRRRSIEARGIRVSYKPRPGEVLGAPQPATAAAGAAAEPVARSPSDSYLEVKTAGGGPWEGGSAAACVGRPAARSQLFCSRRMLATYTKIHNPPACLGMRATSRPLTEQQQAPQQCSSAAPTNLV